MGPFQRKLNTIEDDFAKLAQRVEDLATTQANVQSEAAKSMDELDASIKGEVDSLVESMESQLRSDFDAYIDEHRAELDAMADGAKTLRTDFDTRLEGFSGDSLRELEASLKGDIDSLVESIESQVDEIRSEFDSSLEDHSAAVSGAFEEHNTRLESLLESQLAEVVARRQETALINDTMSALESATKQHRDEFDGLATGMQNFESTQQRQRELAIERTTRRALGTMQHAGLGMAFAGWCGNVVKVRRQRNLMQKSVARIEHVRVARAFVPWLAGARAAADAQLSSASRWNLQSKAIKRMEHVQIARSFLPWLARGRVVRQEQAGQARDSRQAVALEQSLREELNELGTRITGDIDSLSDSMETLRSDVDAHVGTLATAMAEEVVARRQETELVNDAMAALESITSQSVETSEDARQLQRELAIERTTRRALGKMQHAGLGMAFAGWRGNVVKVRRQRNLMQKSVARIEHVRVARAFSPWLAGARAAADAQLSSAGAAEVHGAIQQAELIVAEHGALREDLHQHRPWTCSHAR
jgi:hypothetical protein